MLSCSITSGNDGWHRAGRATGFVENWWNSSLLGADGISAAQHSSKLDRATGLEWTCDTQHFRVRNKPFLRDRQKVASFFNIFIHLSPFPSCHFQSLKQVEIIHGCQLGIPAANVTLDQRAHGLSSWDHCQNMPGVSSQVLRDTF